MRLKVCGITRLEDAIFASQLGVWALGFIFIPQSPRVVYTSRVEEIVKILNIYYPSVLKVGVFADNDEKTVRDTVSICSLDIIQFHGKESPEFTKRFSNKKIRAFIIEDRTNLTNLVENIDSYDDCIPLLDLPKDRYVPFSTLIETAYKLKEIGRNFILAGGISIDNIREVISLDPFAIDIARGIEVIPGIKDREKLEMLVSLVKKEGR
ncbi:MAG: phosphoribosylanthranilate isomerase [bacterium]